MVIARYEIRPGTLAGTFPKAQAGVLARALAALVLAVGCSFDDHAPATAADAPSEDVVERVVDGDTIALGSGTVVRLVQIDAPEVRGSECYADEPPPLDFLDGAGDCYASYEPCLPVVGDLDCADVRALGKAPVGVSGSDPYRRGGDADGTGCK